MGAKVPTLHPADTGHFKAFDAETGKLVWDKPQSFPATAGLTTAQPFTAYDKQSFTIISDDERIWPIYYADWLEKNAEGDGVMVFGTE